MKIQYELLSAIVCISMLYVTNVLGLPRHIFGGQSRSRRTHMIEYRTPDDYWNISSVPRSVEPHLLATHEMHDVPRGKTNEELEDELLASLRNIKVGGGFSNDCLTYLRGVY